MEYHKYRDSFNFDRAKPDYITPYMYGDVRVEEKIDGSQMSIRMSDEGEVECYSKRQKLNTEIPNKNFKVAVEFAKTLQGSLHSDWTYRGEAVCKPKHCNLKYDRIPTGGFILFDIDTPEGNLKRNGLEEVAKAIGFEVVPCLYKGPLPKEGILNMLSSFLDNESCLGGS